MPTAGLQYDVNGRLNGMTMDDHDGHGAQSFANATYTPAGQLYQLSWGFWQETDTYNSLNQLTNQSIGGVLNMTYNYSATQNNGRIANSQDAITGENTTYSYDALNRLTAALSSSWNQNYTYDGFGNLLTKSYAGGSPNPSPAVSLSYSAKNQITNSGYSYDGNGNLECNGNFPNCATYNVENRVVYSGAYGSQTVYAYDPWGKRVMVNSGGSSGTYTWTFYGIMGQPLAMVQCDASSFPGYPTCAVAGQNVYFGKRMIVSGGVNVVTDRLGTIRANSQGESFAYYPYGDERTNTVNGRPKFGTYFRDAAGQDYADQRYYGSGTGGFWSADPGGIKTADPTDPGSLNRYAYVGGDPVNYVDAGGLFRQIPPSSTGPSVPPPPSQYGGANGSAVTFNSGPNLGDDDEDAPPQGGPCNMNNPLNAQAINWISAHSKDASDAAGKLGTTEAIILGLSAYESGWGNGDFVTGKYNNGIAINNFFSQHAPAPNENGTVTINGNYMATYASYAASATGFTMSASGQLIQGVTDPGTAIKDLQDAGLYGINRDGSKVADFVQNVTDTINFIARRFGCVQ